MEFPDWLKKQLDRRNMSQQGLARLLGVRDATVSAWIHGKADPREEHIKALAEMFDTDTYELYLMLNRIEPFTDFDAEVEAVARRIGQAPPGLREKIIDLIIAMLDFEGA
jgi:transcriptional regulator with XRE-family HTH domain